MTKKQIVNTLYIALLQNTPRYLAIIFLYIVLKHIAVLFYSFKQQQSIADFREIDVLEDD